MSRPAGVRRALPRIAACSALLVLALLALTATSSAHQESEHHHSDHRHALAVVSSAQPSDARPTVTDRAYDVSRTPRRSADLRAVATSSAGCDGCRGDAWTVQVVDARHARTVHADNVATAWAGCTGCGSDVVSVQVVLVRDQASLVVNNRALSLNAHCSGCDSSAAAYQVAVTTEDRADLEAMRDEVVEWLSARQPGAAGSASPHTLAAPRAAGPRKGLQALADLAAGAVGGEVLAEDVQVR